MKDDELRDIQAPQLSEQDLERLQGASIFDPSELDGCIVAVLEGDGGPIALYDYDALCDVFYDPQDPHASRESAQEWVDFNLVRALPYIAPRAPLIGLLVSREDDEEYGEDVEYIRHQDKIYVRL